MAALVCAMFFLSGASALVFETLWFHQASLAVGNSVWASSLVLAGFMGGLALGNALAARAGDRLRSPLRVYAWVEVAIALTGVPLVLFLPDVGIWLAPWLAPLLDDPWLINPLRLLVAFALLLVPSTAMGVTLPLLARALTAAGGRFGRVLGSLYGWNTAGAVAGVALAEFAMIGAFGIRTTAFCAGGLNLAIALAAVALARRFDAPRPEQLGDVQWGRAAPWLAVVFVSGFVLLALEVVWFRLLALFVQNRGESFAAMLCVVLGGISLGGLAVAIWPSRTAPARRVPAVALVASIACVGSYAGLPLVLAPHGVSLVKGPLEIASLAMPLILPVSVLSGFLFTVVGAALREELPGDAATAGALTLANTLGSALGALAGGFLLLPLLGVELSIFALAVVYAVVGAAVGLRHAPRRIVTAVVVVATLVGLALFPFGSMRGHFLQIPVARWTTSPEERVAAVREGTTATLTYVEQNFLGVPRSHQLLTNSIRMSTTEFWARRFMKLYVYWPLAVRPDTKNALLICYGLGSTARALSDAQQFEEVDVVDISPNVLEMSDLIYPDPEDNPLRDPRFRLHVEDGRYFLATTSKRYDLITGDPPPPRAAGVVNLYTREYFESMRERLNEGGVVTYWLPLHGLSEVATRAVLRSFCDVFDDCSLWHGIAENLVMIGTRNAAEPPTLREFTRQWRDPKVGPEMQRLGFERPEQIGALFIGDAAYLDELVSDSPPLVDDRPKLVSAPSAFEDEPPLYRDWRDAAAARERFVRSPLIERLWPAGLAERSVPYFRYQQIINEFGRSRRPDLSLVIEDLHALLTETALRQPVLWLLGSDADHQQAVDRLDPSLHGHPLVQFHLGARRLADRDYAGAARAFANAHRRPDDPQVRRQLSLHNTFRRVLRNPPIQRSAFRMHVYALSLAGQPERAREALAASFQVIERRNVDAPFWVWMKSRLGVGPSV